jgi:predicted membrane chloride channel (bestrophin family)
MIVYDNGDYLGVLFRVSGSVIPECLPVSLFVFCIGLSITIIREHTDLMANAGEYVEHPLGVRIIATVLGLLLAMRTNMGLNRWMDGISQVQLMLSKWGDAYLTLCGFFADRVKEGDEEMQLRCLLFRTRIAHWFSLMSCLAFATLRARQIQSLDAIPIQEMFEDEEEQHVSTFGEHGHRPEVGKMRSDGSSRPSQSSNGSYGSAPHMPEKLHELPELPELDLMVLSAPSRLETQLLEIATDKVNAVYLWITQGIIEEVRTKMIDTPPPIVGRVFAELSNGKLGFAQAHKVAMVPFPFPFAQMISVLMTISLALMPIYIELFTRNPIMSPLLCFLTPLCYMCLNRVAVELEEPFGSDWNDVDIEIRHHEFILMLADTIRMSTVPPNYKQGKGAQSFQTEEHILRGASRDFAPRALNSAIQTYLAKVASKKEPPKPQDGLAPTDGSPVPPWSPEDKKK